MARVPPDEDGLYFHTGLEATGGADQSIVRNVTVSCTLDRGADVDTSMITTLGWVYMKNLDPTNFVQYGPKVSGSMVAFGRLKAGESVLYRLEPGVAIRWVANAADVNVFVKFYND